MNSLSDELLISVSLRFFAQVLSCSFILEHTPLCSAVLPDFVSVSTQWVKQAPLPVLTERPHVRDKRSTLPQLLVVSVLAQAAYYIFNGSTSWGCAKTCHCPKKEDLNNYLQAVWKLDPQAAAFKSMTERQSRGTTSTHFNPWVVQKPSEQISVLRDMDKIRVSMMLVQVLWAEGLWT